MDRVSALAGALASTISAARQMADGTERLAEIFQRAGAQLQEVVPDSCIIGHGLSDEIRCVAELLLAWREVGEVGVVFASHMLQVSTSMSHLVAKMEMETKQRFAEAQRLVQTSSGEGQDEKSRNWFGRLVRRAGKAEDSEHRQKERELFLATCLGNVGEQLETVRIEGKRCISDAVVFVRAESKVVGDRVSLLKAHWRGGAREACPSVSTRESERVSSEPYESHKISTMPTLYQASHKAELLPTKVETNTIDARNPNPAMLHQVDPINVGPPQARISPVVNIDYWKIPLPLPTFSDEEEAS